MHAHTQQSFNTINASMRPTIYRLITTIVFLAIATPITAMSATATATDITTPDTYTCSESGYITFETMNDGFNLSANSINGVNFTTTNGYTWLVGDFATGNYNGKYPTGSYTSQGTHWAWLGASQGYGRIVLVNGPASSFSLLISDNTSVVLEAYDNNGNLLSTAGPATINTDTGEMSELKITRDIADISYLIVHDSGNYFLVDSICTDASGVPYQALQDYKQNKYADGSPVRWASDHIFDVPGTPNGDCPVLMEGYGCAITSLTDVVASYGLSTLPDGSSTDPGYLNHFLGKNKSTHDNHCNLIFPTTARVLGKNLIYDDPAKTTSLATKIKHIDDAISAGNLVIAGGISTGHYIVLYEKAPPAPDGSPDYYIADPYRYATGDRSGKTLYQAYHQSIDQLDTKLRIVVLENKAPKPGVSWVITGHSPIQLLITDPTGARTGYDEYTDSYIQNIASSSYGVEQGIADDTGVDPPQPDYIYFGLNELKVGTYTVEVIGTGNGPYELDFMEASDTGGSAMQTLSSQITLGQIDSYLVTEVSGQPLTIQRQVIIDIKPGQDSTALNLGSKGKTPVALLSSNSFNATNVDLTSIKFGPSNTPAVDKNIDIEDINNDGMPDVVFHFLTQNTGIKSSDRDACLTGTMDDGTKIIGCDTFKIVP